MLTDIAIRNARPEADRTKKLSDGGGLQLWISPTGGKSWNLAYRFNGKQRKLNLGPYPTVTLAEARSRRDVAKRQIEAGVSPSEQKQIDKLTQATSDAITFEAVADELLEKKKRERKAEATLSKVGWLLDFGKASLGTRPIAKITAPEVLAVLRRVESRGRLETAKRLRATIGEVFRYAIATGRAEQDPTVALRGALVSPIVQHRAAIVEEAGFGGLLRAIDGYDGTPEVRAGIQLLALTFVRPGELRHAQWKEFDLDRAVWLIPAERMKMRRAHKVPLAPQALTILRDLFRLSGPVGLVLPGSRAFNRPMSENTMNASLRRLGYGNDQMTAHGFRAAASTMLNECGLWNPDAIEAQLAHSESNAARKAYARAEYWDERVKMMSYWSNKLDEMRRADPL